MLFPAEEVPESHMEKSIDGSDFPNSDSNDAPETVQHLVAIPPPDVGLWAWLQVVVLFFGTWNSWGVINTFGVYQEYYQTTLLPDTPAGTISWIGTLAGVLTLSGAMMVGPLYDLGYVKEITLAAAILQSFSFMMLSLCKKYYQILLCQGILSGIASSMAFVGGVSSVGTWFHRHRPLAVGIGATGSAFGGVVYSVVARQTLKNVGFAWGARIIGFITLATQLTAFICSKQRLPPRKTGGFFDWHAFREFDMNTLSWSLLLTNSGAYVFYFYAQAYALSELKNPNYDILIYTTTIISAGSVPGRIIPNYLAQLFGPVTIFAASVAATAILCWFWLMAKSTAAILIIAALIGFTTGPVVSLPAPACASITPDISRLGTRLSFVYIHGAIGLIVGPPLAGIMIRDHAWKYGIIYAGSLCSLGFVVSVACRQYLVRDKTRTRV